MRLFNLTSETNGEQDTLRYSIPKVGSSACCVCTFLTAMGKGSIGLATVVGAKLAGLSLGRLVGAFMGDWHLLVSAIADCVSFHIPF